MCLPRKRGVLLGLIALNGVLATLIFLSMAAPASEREMEEVSILASSPMDFRELSVFFEGVAKEKGAVYAFDVLRVAPIPPGIDLHLLGHLIGNALYEEQGLEGIQHCTQDFRNACSHSVVIGAFLEYGDAVLDSVADACRQAPGGRGAYRMCFHGLGHGVLAYADYEMDKAVPLCKRAGEAAGMGGEYEECVGGVVMEMMGGVHDRDIWEAKKAKYFSATNPLAPCDMAFMPDDMKPVCYTFLTPHLFEFVGANMANPTPEDFKKAFRICSTIPEFQNQQECYASFGKEFVVLAQNRDIRKIDEMSAAQLATIGEWCSYASNEEGELGCVESALGSLYWGGENDVSAATKFCELARTNTIQARCFTNLIGQVHYFEGDSAQRKEFCASLPDAYHNQCTSRLEVY